MWIRGCNSGSLLPGGRWRRNRRFAPGRVDYPADLGRPPTRRPLPCAEADAPGTYPVRSVLGTSSRKRSVADPQSGEWFLVCIVLPDLGGHSTVPRQAGGYGCFANPSIKAMIGLRGVWAALGVELNFPWDTTC